MGPQCLRIKLILSWGGWVGKIKLLCLKCIREKCGLAAKEPMVWQEGWSTGDLPQPLSIGPKHRSNKEYISKVYLGSMCIAVLIGCDVTLQPTPPLALGLIYEGAIGQPRWTTSLCDPLVQSIWIRTYNPSYIYIRSRCKQFVQRSLKCTDHNVDRAVRTE